MVSLKFRAIPGDNYSRTLGFFAAACEAAVSLALFEL